MISGRLTSKGWRQALKREKPSLIGEQGLQVAFYKGVEFSGEIHSPRSDFHDFHNMHHFDIIDDVGIRCTYG